MKVGEIFENVPGRVLVDGGLDRRATGCYVSDLLSDVLANGKAGNLWITQHTHPNVVAVASVKELAGVIIVGGKNVEPETVERARMEKVNVMASALSAFEVAGAVYNLMKDKEAKRPEEG